MTESLSSGLIDVNGGARSLRKRDERSVRLPLDDSSVNVSINFFTTVLISVVDAIIVSKSL
jgi:hypothetical protein